MAKERKASVIYEGNASQLVYAFPFDYLRKKFVKVEDIYTNITELTIGVDYTVEDKQVRLVKGIPVGHFVKIYRKTTTDPLVEWQDASVLRSDDLSLQEVQLLHLAEEALDMAQDKGLTTDDNDGVWDARYNKIKNLLEPTEAGDAVNLGYITKNQDSLLNKLNSTGATQNKSIVATGDAQNARLIATGEAQNTRLLATGDNKNKTLEDTGDAQNERLIATGNEQNTRLTVTGTYQNKLVTDTGKSYVSTMTTLKDTVVNRANEANSSADLAQKWAEAEDSPNGEYGSKSSLVWAREAQESENKAAASASAAKSSADSSASSASTAAQTLTQIGTSVEDAANSAKSAENSAASAANSLSQLGEHEANAAASAAAAAESAALAKAHADNASQFDPTLYFKAAPEMRGTETDIKQFTIPSNKAGMYTIIYGYPDKYVVDSNSYPHAIIANFNGNSGTFLSLYAQPNNKKLYFRSGWTNAEYPWKELATTEDLTAINANIVNTLQSKERLTTTSDTAITVPFEKGMYTIVGKPAGKFYSGDAPTGKYATIANFKGTDGGMLSLYAVDGREELYYRTGWDNDGWKLYWHKIASMEALNNVKALMPTKLSQLTNDANYATTTDVATAVEKSATTIKAQIPKATSQLTNDSGYATTESVDNKIGAIWDEPLDWDIIESTSIMDGTAIIYDNSYIPARFRLQLLYDIFKKDTDTQLDNYVLKTDYSQEAQKWKDAYNNLRKRSTPTAFDDDELTVLMNTPIERGTITLSQPYTDFDGLLIDFSDDDGALLNSKYISTAELNRRIARAKDIGISSIFLLSEYFYWTIWITERSGFSTTTFPNRGENCQIKCIYGVKLKEIT